MSTEQPKPRVRRQIPKFDPKVLSDVEAFWRDHQKWLQERGYMLRPRFIPGWKPSWIDENGKEIESWTSCEDSRPLKVSCPATVPGLIMLIHSARRHDMRRHTYV